MRSSRPVPGDAWPSDMVIHVTEDSDDLLDLLWVRHRYGLHPRGEDLPPAPSSVGLPPAETDSADRQEWSDAWGPLWSAALRRRDPAPGPGVRAEAVAVLDDDEVFALLTGPTWRSRFGDSAFGPDHADWLERLDRRRAPMLRAPLHLHPERRSLPALVRAWRRGLTEVVTLPLAGAYTRTLSPTTLLVAETTREHPDEYAAALDRFAP